MINWLNGKGNALWRILVGISIAIILSVGGWTFSQVRDMPDKYIKKQDIIARLDKFETNIDKRMCDLEQAMRNLNMFLLDYFSSDTEIHSEPEKPDK